MCYFQQKSYLEDSSVGPTPTVGFVFPHVAFICSLFSVECMQCCEVDGGRGWKGWSNGEVEGGREEWVWEGRREETKYWESWSSKMMGWSACAVQLTVGRVMMNDAKSQLYIALCWFMWPRPPAWALPFSIHTPHMPPAPFEWLVVPSAAAAADDLSQSVYHLQTVYNAGVTAATCKAQEQRKHMLLSAATNTFL